MTKLRNPKTRNALLPVHIITNKPKAGSLMFPLISAYLPIYHEYLDIIPFKYWACINPIGSTLLKCVDPFPNMSTLFKFVKVSNFNNHFQVCQNFSNLSTLFKFVKRFQICQPFPSLSNLLNLSTLFMLVNPFQFCQPFSSLSTLFKFLNPFYVSWTMFWYSSWNFSVLLLLESPG